MIHNDFAAGFRAKKNEIKRLNKRIAELENQWISVEDRLPVIVQSCLAYMQRRGASITNVVNTQFTKYGFERASVTHWMPLPEPPTINTNKV